MDADALATATAGLTIAPRDEVWRRVLDLLPLCDCCVLAAVERAARRVAEEAEVDLARWAPAFARRYPWTAAEFARGDFNIIAEVLVAAAEGPGSFRRTYLSLAARPTSDVATRAFKDAVREKRYDDASRAAELDGVDSFEMRRVVEDKQIFDVDDDRRNDGPRAMLARTLLSRTLGPKLENTGWALYEITNMFKEALRGGHFESAHAILDAPIFVDASQRMRTPLYKLAMLVFVQDGVKSFSVPPRAWLFEGETGAMPPPTVSPNVIAARIPFAERVALVADYSRARDLGKFFWRRVIEDDVIDLDREGFDLLMKLVCFVGILEDAVDHLAALEAPD